MAVAAEGQGASLRDVRIHHNLFYSNRGSGIFFALWGQDGPRSAVRIYQNTFYKNGKPNHWSGPTGSIDLRSQNIADVEVVNNLCSGGGAYEIGTFDDPADGLGMLAAKNVRLDRNLTGVFLDDTSGTFLYGRNYGWLGENPIQGDPLLTNPANGAFFLTDGSPAAGAGLAEEPYLTEDGRPADLGAFALGYEQAPEAEPYLEPVFEGVWRVVQGTRPGSRYWRETSADLSVWRAAPAAVPGNHLPDLHYFRPGDGEAWFVRYRITDLSR